MRLVTSDGSRANPNFPRAANEVIRELEAELAAERVVKEDVTGWWKEQKARAAELEAAEPLLAEIVSMTKEFIMRAKERFEAREREAETDG